MRLKIFALTMTCLLVSSSYAQNDNGHDRIVSVGVSPLSAVFGTADVTAQVKLLDFMSVTIPVHGGYNWVWPSIVGALSKAGGLDIGGKEINVGGGVGLRFLLRGNGLSDTFYLEPRLTIDYKSSDYSSKKLDAFHKLGDLTMTPSARLGWDWYYDSGFYMSLGLGLGYTFPLKRDLSLSDNMKKLASDNFLASWILPTEQGSGRFYFDPEFKLGFAF